MSTGVGKRNAGSESTIVKKGKRDQATRGLFSPRAVICLRRFGLSKSTATASNFRKPSTLEIGERSTGQREKERERMTELTRRFAKGAKQRGKSARAS